MLLCGGSFKAMEVDVVLGGPCQLWSVSEAWTLLFTLFRNMSSFFLSLKAKDEN